MEMRSVLRGIAFLSIMLVSRLAYSQSSVTLYGIIDTGVEYYNGPNTSRTPARSVGPSA